MSKNRRLYSFNTHCSLVPKTRLSICRAFWRWGVALLACLSISCYHFVMLMEKKGSILYLGQDLENQGKPFTWTKMLNKNFVSAGV